MNKAYAIKIKKSFVFLYKFENQWVLDWEQLCQVLDIKFYTTGWIRDMSGCDFQPPIRYGLDYDKLPQILKILNHEDLIEKCQYIRPVVIVRSDEEKIRIEAEKKILNLLERIK